MPSSPVSVRPLKCFHAISAWKRRPAARLSHSEYLEQVWAAVSKEAIAMIFTDADATGFEEDAR